MKKIICICVLFFMLIVSGCEEQMQNNSSDFPAVDAQKACLFVPDKIKFNQLTEYVGSGQINVYVDVLDQFGSRLKASGIWRFELFQYAQRSAEPKGARVYLWQDIDLTNANVNSGLWQDYLRCYKIELVFEADIESGRTYILQAICTTAEGKRITDSFELKL